MSNLVTVTGLTKTFRVTAGRQLVAVAGIDFKIEAGEVLGLIGESGSGKSTVARCLVGLAQPDSGTIDWSTGRRPRIGMVFQDPRDSMNPKFPIWESIADPLTASGVRRRSEIVAAVKSVAHEVGLRAEQLLAYPKDISDEALQRASIARALVVNPQLVVLDEPTSSLDPEGRAAVLELIQQLARRRNSTVLLISHDLSAVRNVSNRVCIMYLGKLMEVGSASALFERPVHPYTSALLSSYLQLDPADPPKPQELIGEIPDPLDRPPGCPLAPRCPLAISACSQAEPPLVPCGPNRVVACIRADEIAEHGIEAIRLGTAGMFGGPQQEVQHSTVPLVQ